MFLDCRSRPESFNQTLYFTDVKSSSGKLKNMWQADKLPVRYQAAALNHCSSGYSLGLSADFKASHV